MPNAEAPHTQVNLDMIYEILATQYRTFSVSQADYAHVASQLTPEALARKMTLGLDNRTVYKDGKAVHRTLLTSADFGRS